MRILVTGAKGYIGSALADRLRSTHELIEVGRSDSLPLKEKSVHVCVHCAVGPSAMIRFIQILRAWPDAHHIYLSSYGVYGGDSLPSRLRDYITQKRFEEATLPTEAARSTILRLSHVYGPNQGRGNPGRLLVDWMRSAVDTGQIVVVDGMREWRDYVCLIDVLRVIEWAVVTPDPRPHRVYDVGSGWTRMLSDYAVLVSRVMGDAVQRSITIRHALSSWETTKFHVNLLPLIQDMDFKTTGTFEEGARDLYEATVRQADVLG